MKEYKPHHRKQNQAIAGIIKHEIEPRNKPKGTTLLLNKKVTSDLKNMGVTPSLVKKLETAIIDVNTQSLEKLTSRGVISHLPVKGMEGVYVYRVDGRKRMIFTEREGTRVIHDIVNIEDIK